jgi:hypothetical protein
MSHGWRVHALMVCIVCWVQVHEGQAQLKEKTAALTAANDQLKLCKMELEGANAQLQVCAAALELRL